MEKYLTTMPNKKDVLKKVIRNKKLGLYFYLFIENYYCKKKKKDKCLKELSELDKFYDDCDPK